MTTTWRYCISRERKGDEDWYAVRELYTDDADGSLSWSAEPVAPGGATWMACAEDVAMMNRALSPSVLDLTLDPPALVSGRELRRES